MLRYGGSINYLEENFIKFTIMENRRMPHQGFLLVKAFTFKNLLRHYATHYCEIDNSRIGTAPSLMCVSYINYSVFYTSAVTFFIYLRKR